MTAPVIRHAEALPSGADSLAESGVAASPLSDAKSTAEVLRALRREFPDMPLAERVAALTVLSRS